MRGGPISRDWTSEIADQCKMAEFPSTALVEERAAILRLAVSRVIVPFVDVSPCI